MSEETPTTKAEPLSLQVDHHDMTTVIDNDKDEARSSQVPVQQEEITENIRNEGGGDDGEEEQDYEADDFLYNDAEIQRDAATQSVALAVHIALGFFACVFVVAGVLVVLLVSQFGLLAFASLFILLFVFGGIAYLLEKTLQDEQKLQPVRRKIRRWKALATAVVLREMRNFQLDWHEHLLLTDGTSDYDLYEEDNENNVGGTAAAASQKKIRGGGGRSVVFGLVVKPFLKVRGFRKRRRQKKEEKQRQQQDQEKTIKSEENRTSTQNYTPPETTIV